eukprot:TRINITY_DN497_c2_g2_i1.p1 TRINITY_DN497_c2_g2~~TRINITY_DN497_c2_g2_i1.p1  ORF type:complete len:211 (+),score=82.86 TRINITY_DN497_c2_g2_i1:49-681(+)
MINKNNLLSIFIYSIIFGLFINYINCQQGECIGSSCRECVQNPACGWCQSNIQADSCLEGDASGPSNPQGRCLLGVQDDEWYFGSCSDPCSQFGVCSECQQSNCGWCFAGGDSRCTSSPANCPGFDWRPIGRGCDMPIECEEHTRCESCLDDNGCRYCPGKGCFDQPLEDDEQEEDTQQCSEKWLTKEDGVENCPQANAAASKLSSLLFF